MVSLGRGQREVSGRGKGVERSGVRQEKLALPLLSNCTRSRAKPLAWPHYSLSTSSHYDLRPGTRRLLKSPQQLLHYSDLPC
jgi:hypothetical protein